MGNCQNCPRLVSLTTMLRCCTLINMLLTQFPFLLRSNFLTLPHILQLSLCILYWQLVLASCFLLLAMSSLSPPITNQVYKLFSTLHLRFCSSLSFSCFRFCLCLLGDCVLLKSCLHYIIYFFSSSFVVIKSRSISRINKVKVR